MLGKGDVFSGKACQRRHLFFVARIVQRVDSDQQHVLTRPHITVAQIAQRILHRNRLRVPLFNQSALILLRIQQAVLLQEPARGHWVGERQVGALHGDRPVEVRIGPDIGQVRSNKGGKEQGGYRLGVATTARQAAQLLPAPVGKQQLHQQDHRHADKHQLPVAGHLVLVRVDHQLPDNGVQVQVETGKDFAVDQQQRHADGCQHGGERTHQPLRHHHKG